MHDKPSYEPYIKVIFGPGVLACATCVFKDSIESFLLLLNSAMLVSDGLANVACNYQHTIVSIINNTHLFFSFSFTMHCFSITFKGSRKLIFGKVPYFNPIFYAKRRYIDGLEYK